MREAEWKNIQERADEIERFLRLEGDTEIVVVSVVCDDNSAIWYMRGGKLYTFCTPFGAMEREDKTVREAAERIARIDADGSLVFLRGAYDRDIS